MPEPIRSAVGRIPPLVRRTVAAPFASVILLIAAAPASAACGSAGYTYAGFQSTTAAYGVGARVTVVGIPDVRSGHVGAWVGVGGPGEGPGGADEWLQVGFSAFAGSDVGDVYYEVARRDESPRYVEVESGVAVGAQRTFAVLETADRPGVWRVWVNGRPVSPRIALPGSHGRWRPVATVESWGGGRSVCNGFDYRFDRISVARGVGGSWAPLAAAYPIRSPGYRVSRPSPASFVAASAPPARTELANG